MLRLLKMYFYGHLTISIIVYILELTKFYDFLNKEKCILNTNFLLLHLTDYMNCR